MITKRLFITVKGIVQGVGFRPFVYNLSINNNLKGWVNNNSEGVYIDIEGTEEELNNFLYNLTNNPPPLSKIEKVNVEEKSLVNFKSFEIKESERDASKITLISPDIAVCEDCLQDIKDINNRRYRYAFTNCTNCGPRFSIIKSIPYDREKTTMNKFDMCQNCNDEYKNPLNRRFHAQPNACSVCGPELWVTDKNGEKISTTDALKYTVNKLKAGSIFAIKGLTGFHLVCNAEDASVIDILRKRKYRPSKPFALMVKDLATAKKYCFVSKEEERLLTGIRKPIVLLTKKNNCNLPDSISPHQNSLGIMLPYTPLHELLFMEVIEALIMTSANISGLPLEYENEAAIEKLGDIVDYFLMHNREVYTPVDDSVTKVVNREERIIRRARGYVPEPLKYEKIIPILACGSNMKNTFAIGKEDFIFLSQYNGDLENIETYNHYKKNIDHFKNLFSFKPKYVACDMHPEYMSSDYAKSQGIPLIEIQHHHAHIVSCMVENNLSNKVIGISFDGTGYGTDGNVWGGEFLIADKKHFSRVGYLDYSKLPGGEIAVREPWRMAISHIYKTYEGKDNLNVTNHVRDYINNTPIDTVIKKLYGNSSVIIKSLIENNLNCINTSSMGRLFDAVSSIIGIKDKITYEGEASILLEANIDKGILESYNYKILNGHSKDNNAPYNYILNTESTIGEILFDKFNNVPISIMASKFHNTIINASVDMCIRIREKTNVNEICLSGGVFQNSYILSNLINNLESNDFKVYSHKTIPTNDGGISLGQIAIANEIINK